MQQIIQVLSKVYPCIKKVQTRDLHLLTSIQLGHVTAIQEIHKYPHIIVHVLGLAL